MKLANLKRLPIGTNLRLTHCLLGPVAPEKQLRTVARVQSNALVVHVEHTGRESWLHFPKASEFRETPSGFEVLEGTEVAARYEWVS